MIFGVRKTMNLLKREQKAKEKEKNKTEMSIVMGLRILIN